MSVFLELLTILWYNISISFNTEASNMAYKNNHFVPQLILRRFGEEISTYNVKTGEYHHGKKTAEVFSKYEFRIIFFLLALT